MNMQIIQKLNALNKYLSFVVLVWRRLQGCNLAPPIQLPHIFSVPGGGGHEGDAPGLILMFHFLAAALAALLWIWRRWYHVQEQRITPGLSPMPFLPQKATAVAVTCLHQAEWVPWLRLTGCFPFQCPKSPAIHTTRRVGLEMSFLFLRISAFIFFYFKRQVSSPQGGKNCLTVRVKPAEILLSSNILTEYSASRSDIQHPAESLAPPHD